jgi:hypothetical protein
MPGAAVPQTRVSGTPYGDGRHEVVQPVDAHGRHRKSALPTPA